MHLIFRILRWLTLLARTERSEIRPIEKCLRAFWLIPFFGLLVFLLRVRYFVFGSLHVDCRTADGINMKCRLPDLIPLYIATFGTWEPDVTSRVREHLQPGDTFIDVGANVGYHTLIASQIVGPDGHVVAIEPDPMNRSVLETNIAKNDIGRCVRIVSGAAWHKKASLHMARSFAHNLGRSQTKADGDGPLIDAAPLDEWLTDDEVKSARIVKIDVEGAEPQVLQGMVAMIDRCPNDVIILVELSPQWWDDDQSTPGDVLQPFLDRGFKPYEHANSYWPWRYLWQRCVAQPMLRTDLTTRPRRIDILLTREALS